MRHVLARMILIAMIGSALPAHAAGGSIDWLLVRAHTTDSAATDVAFSFSVEATGTGGDVALLGFGFADSGYPGSIDVVPAGGGPIRVSTTRDAGGADLTIVGGERARAAHVTVDVVYDRVEPYSSIAAVLFVTGMDLTRIPADIAVMTTSGAVTVTIDSGAGSRAIAAADPDGRGIAVGAGPVAAAHEATHVATMQAGIVGAFATFDFCYACSAAWRAPTGDGGRTNALDAWVVGAAEGDHSFAGPAGAWSWEWTGMGITRNVLGIPERFPAFAAYAPIGDAWVLFRGA